MEIRADEALAKEAPVSDFSKVFAQKKRYGVGVSNKNNPFGQMGNNPFYRRDKDSFC